MPTVAAGMSIALSSPTIRHSPGAHPGKTNREVFSEDFRKRTGIDVEAHWDVFDDFYRDVFPTLGDGYGPVPGAREAIAQARALDLRVAVATQPIFPVAAIMH